MSDITLRAFRPDTIMFQVRGSDDLAQLDIAGGARVPAFLALAKGAIDDDGIWRWQNGSEDWMADIEWASASHKPDPVPKLKFVAPGVYQDPSGSIVAKVATVILEGFEGDDSRSSKLYEPGGEHSTIVPPIDWEDAINEAWGRLRGCKANPWSGYDRAVITHGSGRVIYLDSKDKIRMNDEMVARAREVHPCPEEEMISLLDDEGGTA